MHDVIIIGAGVIGASVARELSKYQLQVAVLEAKSDVAMGSSGANSAIVHAGYDCKPGTWMARTNVRGNALYDILQKELDIPFRRIGSLVLGFHDDDIEELNRLLEQGRQNGVPDLKILTTEEVLEMEPAISREVKAALWAPSAGITCPYELTIAMMENAIENGVEVYLDHPVVSIRKDEAGYFIVNTPGGTFKSRAVINCAGLYSDEIAKMLGDNDFRIIPRKGEYCLYDRKYGSIVNKVIFQVPGKMGKGVLVTPTVDGNLLVGPSAQDIERKDDTQTTAEGLQFVIEKALLSVPSLPKAGVIRSFAGLRAVGSTGDFILGPSKRVEGLFHAAGICSPGLSSAPAIAEELSYCLIRAMGGLKKKEKFSPYRKGRPRFRDLTWDVKQDRIKQNLR